MASSNQYILKTPSGLYAGRGHGNSNNPKAYGLHPKPAEDDWRNSEDLCRLEERSWKSWCDRTGEACPIFAIATRPKPLHTKAKSVDSSTDFEIPGLH